MSHYPGDGGKGDRSGGRHRRRGGRTLALPADVIKESGLRTLFDEAVRPFGPADILVDNAGVHASGPLEETAEDDFRHQLDTDVLVLLAPKEAVGRAGPGADPRWRGEFAGRSGQAGPTPACGHRPSWAWI
ncbi:SDR family NAD(P)-dependent oxidoreductase [Streptomyces sp. NPDC052492]|uniref:SDR family NAD(P)-dependent oxidoreductase n=1 Tax=Streptomyces sp. NPDC052492 TaxID=3365691 RepID=UPI0037D94496